MQNVIIIMEDGAVRQVITDSLDVHVLILDESDPAGAQTVQFAPERHAALDVLEQSQVEHQPQQVSEVLAQLESALGSIPGVPSGPYYVWHGEGQCDNVTEDFTQACQMVAEFAGEGLPAYITDADHNVVPYRGPLTREMIAQDQFESYDFGQGVTVTDHGAWDKCDPQDLVKTVYVAFDEDGVDDDSHRLFFHVRFDEAGAPVEAYALDAVTGNEIGQSGVTAATA